MSSHGNTWLSIWFETTLIQQQKLTQSWFQSVQRWKMRKSHYWPLVSAVWRRHQSKPLLFHRELKQRGLGRMWSVIVACHSVQGCCSVFQVLFKSLFSLITNILKCCQGVKLCTANWLLLHSPMTRQRSFGLDWNMAASHVSLKSVFHIHSGELGTAWLSVKSSLFPAWYLPGCPTDGRNIWSNWSNILALLLTAVRRVAVMAQCDWLRHLSLKGNTLL